MEKKFPSTEISISDMKMSTIRQATNKFQSLISPSPSYECISKFLMRLNVAMEEIDLEEASHTKPVINKQKSNSISTSSYNEESEYDEQSLLDQISNFEL